MRKENFIFRSYASGNLKLAARYRVTRKTFNRHQRGEKKTDVQQTTKKQSIKKKGQASDAMPQCNVSSVSSLLNVSVFSISLFESYYFQLHLLEPAI